MHNLALLIAQRRVLADRALPNHGDNAGHGGPGKIVLPVELDDCRQDDGQRQLDRVRAADDGVKPHMEQQLRAKPGKFVAKVVSPDVGGRSGA